ncbi:hypothetical protein V3C99_015508, partial [Haemonchus contortus]
ILPRSYYSNARAEQENWSVSTVEKKALCRGR